MARMPLTQDRAAKNRADAGVESTLRRLWALDLAAEPEVEERARWLLLDTLACAAAGLEEPELQRLDTALGRRLPGRVRWPGSRHALSPTGAATLGTMAACWHEFCEGLAIAHGRPGLHTVPVAVGLGLSEDVTLRRALTGIVVGYEIGARAGMAMRIRAGLHVDGTWGLLGATTAAAYLLNLDETRAMNALATAACQIPSSLYLPVQAGHTARNTYAPSAVSQGVLLAEAAAAGITAPLHVFSEAAAHLAAAPRMRESWAWPDTEQFLILQGYLKPFAAVRHTHYGAEAARRWSTENRASSRRIDALTLETYAEAMTYCGNRAPQTPIQAQFSLSYAVACVLSGYPLTAHAYAPEIMADPECRRLEQLLALRVTEDLRGRGARLTIQCGEHVHRIQVDSVLGDPDMPFTSADLRAKAADLLHSRLGEEGAAELIEAVLSDDIDRPLANVLGQPS